MLFIDNEVVVDGHVYEFARQRGLGRELPTSWFLQNVRD